MQAAGLAGALDDPAADLTVFAPNDAAFVATRPGPGLLPAATRPAPSTISSRADASVEGESPIPLLTQILTYHVAPEELQSSEVLTLSQIPTLLGPTIGRNGTTLIDRDPDLPNPGLIATDIVAANGIVHVINGVLIPADILQSNGANDVDFIIGSDRNNLYRLHADNDYVDANGGHDVVFGGSGRDVILGGTGSDALFGDLGWDVIRGDDGHDRLFGGAGQDRITGGTGRDLILGGTGRDTFVFATGDGRDTVVDFKVSADSIDLSGTGVDDFAELGSLIHFQPDRHGHQPGARRPDHPDRRPRQQPDGDSFDF